ncbi:MAG: hypothetical protein COW84_12095 [Gammaproteobacteria bacterium CG22_combo_CG10-13_8_21_14_all_40_8]|nr:MAG: hypothetical protein COW84_12095 [Gammaproteobacteria bacterium CG22_combo_CG10-13_8_21_14_all_40_8]
MPALQIKGLKKIYANGVEALKGIDLQVEQGDFFALLGPNGAGKSTTIGILTSLVSSSEGSVSIFGHDLKTELEQAKRCLGLVPQEFNFNQFETCQQIVVNQAGFYGIPRKEALKRSDVVLNNLGLGDKKKSSARMLSGGMKRRLMIARALMHQPKLLVLDEPTAGVDIELRRSMWEFLIELNQQGTTIVLTTHYLEEAESLCRNIAIIDQGKIIKNTSMKALLNSLETETFVLDLKNDHPNLHLLQNYEYQQIDDNTLEVHVKKADGLNALFQQLSQQGIEVLSMRNKANRLEELFVKLVNDGKNQQSAGLT